MLTSTRVQRTPERDYHVEFAKRLSPFSNLVFPIDADNNIGSGTPWNSECRAAPYAVRICHAGRFHTVALDFDAKVAGASRAASDADLARRAFAEVGIKTVLVSSGPTGGRHVLARVGGDGLSPEVGARLALRFRDELQLASLDITPMSNKTTGSIRPPLSPHRLGGASTITSHSPDEALRVLDTGADPLAFELLTSAMRLRPLRRGVQGPNSPQANLGDGRKDFTGSADLAAVACRVANRGGDRSDFDRAVDEEAAHNSRLAAHLAKLRASGSFERHLARTWARANEHVRRSPAVRRVAAGDDAALILEWTGSLRGITHPSAHKVGEVLSAECKRYERALVGLSARQASDAANMGKSTAYDALKWLVEHNVIEVAAAGGQGVGTRYRLVPPDSWRDDIRRTVSPTAVGGGGTPTVRGMSQLADLIADVSLDIWSSAGVKEAGRRTMEALFHTADDAGTAHVLDVATRLGVSRRTVERRLQVLGRVGLARNLRKGRWAAEYSDPAELAQRIGAAGHGRSIIARNREDRARQALRQLRDNIQWCVRTRTRYGSLACRIDSAPPENHSQIEGRAVLVAFMKTVLPRPVGSDTTMTGAPATSAASLFGLPTFIPSGRGDVN